MTGATRPGRASREGPPCPSWCESDHGHTAGHNGRAIHVRLPGKVPGLPDQIMPYACQVPGFPPEVAVNTLRYGRDEPGPCAWVSARDAAALAAVVDMLAGAAPDQIRDVAAAIRKAAAQVTEARDA